MSDTRFKNPLLLMLAAGSCLGISLLFSWSWPLVLGGIWLTFHLIDNCDTAKQAFWYGWGVGGIKMLWSLLWFWATYPLDWLGLTPGPLHIILVLLYWIPAGVTLGCSIGIFAWFYKKYLGTLSAHYQYGLTAIAWVVTEIVGAIVFSIYTLGPGSSATAGFSFGHTGYALVEHQFLLSVASIGSVYALSFLVGLLGLVIYKQTPKVAWAIMIILIISAFAPTVTAKPRSLNREVAFVETHFPAPLPTQQKQNNLERKFEYFNIVTSALATDSEVIVLPEDSRFTSYFDDEQAVFTFITDRTKRDVVLIDTVQVEENGVSALRAYIYDTNTKKRYQFDKQYLVPQGEYIPYVYQALIATLGPRDFVAKAVAGTNYRPGVAQTDINIPTHIPAVLFCFESVTPFGVRNSTRGREMPFIAHTVSHAWFKREPEILWHQLDAMLRAQAVFNHIPIVQAANETNAKVYTPQGEIIQVAPNVQTPKWSLYIILL